MTQSGILGGAIGAAEAFTVGEPTPEHRSGESLAEQVRQYIRDRGSRARYVAAATDYLRQKKPPTDTVYDIVLIGAGLHSALFLYTAKRRNPHLKVLIVEQSSDVCSTFARLGDALVLNSPTFSTVGLNSNVAQGHFIQVSDFDELSERQYPTAKHLHELATMILFHADAEILFNCRVDSVEKMDSRYSVVSGDRRLHAESVVIANGMGEPRSNAYARDQSSERVITGDSFISAFCKSEAFREQIRDARVAVVGAGDTANCVLEHLLPLTYPNDRYPTFQKGPFLPSAIYWIGQGANSIKDFFFANKQRYGHSGGIIEFFWDGEAPFDLPADTWANTKARIQCFPEKLSGLSHKGDFVELTVGEQRLPADIVVDCTGRSNRLGAQLLRDEYEFIRGDVVLLGGQWDETEDSFVPAPRYLKGQRIACKIVGERIFLLGCACPLDELIDDDEALDGSLRYQETRQSLTNSKFSLEHTLPRTVAFAEVFGDAHKTRNNKV
ncbi:MAG: hypothetical protein AAF578_07345 [Pseudomonadota bacterium]